MKKPSSPMLTNMPMMAHRHIIMSLLGEIEVRGRSGEEQWAEERSNVRVVVSRKPVANRASDLVSSCKLAPWLTLVHLLYGYILVFYSKSALANIHSTLFLIKHPFRLS